MSPFETTYIGQTRESEIVTAAATRDGYRIVVTQEYLPATNGGIYFYAVFDSANNLRHISTRDSVFLPSAPSANAATPDGRISERFAAAILDLIVPGLMELDALAKDEQSIQQR